MTPTEPARRRTSDSGVERAPTKTGSRQVRGKPRGVKGKTASSWAKALEQPALWSALFLVVGSWALTVRGVLPIGNVEVGEIASRDYTAPTDLLIADVVTTEEKRAQARSEVLPVYDLDPVAATEMDRQLAAFFAEGRSVLESLENAPDGENTPAPEELTLRLQEATGVQADLMQIQRLIEAGFSAEWEDRLRGLARQVLERGVLQGKAQLLENRMRGVNLRNLAEDSESRHLDLYGHLDYPVEVRQVLEAEARDWRDLAPRARGALVDFLLANLRPNLYLNRGETISRQEAAAIATAQVFQQIGRGQVIVRKGDQIDQYAARTIAEIAGSQRPKSWILPWLGTVALLALGAAVMWLALGREKIAGHSRARLFGELLILMLLGFLGTKLALIVGQALADFFSAEPFQLVRSYIYAVPFAGLALTVALLFGRQAAIMLSFVFSILGTRLIGQDALWMFVYSVVGCLAAVFALDLYQFKQRLVMTRVGLVVGGMNLVTVLILTCLNNGLDAEPLQLGFNLLCALVGGLLVAATASFAVPVFESLFAVTTDIKLVELANTNLPLLRRLAFEAPGTFQHSLMVANLAKEGCETIDADPVLAYTGGLYHDIGKILRAEYFIENQRPGHNRHDKLQPSMSALILINHVKDGIELAREHSLPQPIQDAIAQHHGTRLIKYFFNRAKEQCVESHSDVQEEKYRYPGPKPQNKVMGVLLLADGVEAASRTLVEPTPAKVRSLIRTIFDDALRDGQLDETDLTLSDLSQVSKAFARVLSTIFHQRIDYPGFDFNSAPKSSQTRTESAMAAWAS